MFYSGTYLKLLLAVFLMLLGSFYCQLSFASCNQNNFRITELYFLDEKGNPLDPDKLTNGQIIAGRVYARFEGSSTNAHFPLHFSYTEEINGILYPTRSRCIQNTTNLSSNQIPKDPNTVFLFEYTIQWGQDIIFKDIFMRWRTSGNQTECSDSSSSGQCYSSPDGLRLSYDIIELPVKWGDFSGTVRTDNRSVALHWSTTKEWDTSHFEIQRSEDGIDNFRSIGTEQSMGWSQKPSHYSFIDAELPVHAKRLYYRILQVDLNGNQDYSRTIMLDNPQLVNKELHWRVFPNPTKDSFLQLSFNGPKIPDRAEIIIYSMNTSRKFYIRPTERLIDIGYLIKDFPTGVLIMEIITEDGLERIKVIKN